MNTPRPPRDQFLIFGSPVIEEADIAEVVDCLRSGWIGTGPKVARFEREFAAYKAVPEQNVAAVNSCTAALHVSMIAAGLSPGDEVITSAMTFCATVNAIIHAGATPVLADIDPVTLNLDPVAVEARITPRTRAILPVHFAGRPGEMNELVKIAETYELKIIEDCAHAIETEYHGRPAGTFGDFGCFSFYVTKNLVTGEGGMVLARSKGDIERVKILALHGMSKDAWRRFSDSGYKHYQVVECGFKYNMMDLQAAIGLQQLKRLEGYWQRRREIWGTYQSTLSDMPVIRPTEPAADTRHAYHLYTIRIDASAAGIGRDEFLEAMTKRRIGVGVHYLSIAEHPYYQNRYGWRPEEWPNAMCIGRQIVSLPISAKLTNDDVEDVVESVKLCLNPRSPR
jgi:dTDP-4-amino-4,6-dideoxygalactose transaminase